MKQFKKLFAGLLALCMMLVMVPMTMPAYAGDGGPDTPVDYIEVEPISVIEHYNGYWGESYDTATGELKKEYYYIDPAPYVTVYLNDGTVLDGEGGVVYDGYYYGLEFSDTRWVLGTQQAQVSIMDYTDTVEVTVTPHPFREIQVNDITLIQYTGGYYATYWDDEMEVEYYLYTKSPTYTVTLADGSVLESDSDGEIYYNDRWYRLNFDQGYDSQWQLGENTVTATLMGKETTFTATLVETPVESITFDKLEVVENLNGYITDEYDEESGEYVEYFHYDFYPTFTVNFKDGSSQHINNGYVYNGIRYQFEIEQNLKHSLKMGENTLPFRFMGYETEMPVTVIESPVESIEIEPLQIIENTNGYYWDYDYDYETDTYLSFFYYYLEPEITVTMKDGTVKTGFGGIWYNDDYYWLGDNQNSENQLKLGTNTVTYSIMGKEVTGTVEIIKSPIQSVIVDPIKIVEHSCGEYDYSYNEETDEYDLPFYYYNFYPNFTVSMTDGSVYRGEYGSFEYQGTGYSLDFEQDYENQLKLGTNTVTGTLMNKEVTFQVEILESPLTGLTAPDITIIEGTNGSYRDEYNSETGQWETYFCYEIYLGDVTFTLKNGTTLTGTSYTYEGTTYGVEYSYRQDQSPENPWGLGTHEYEFHFMGKTGKFNVNIVESPYTSLEILSVDTTHENQYSYTTEDEMGNEIKIYSIPDFTYRVTTKDGNSFVKSYRNDEDSNISVMSNQYSEPWTIGGKNLFTVQYSTLTTTASAPLAEALYFSYFEQDGAAYITDCMIYDEVLEIPEEIGGLPVVGIASFGEAYWYAEEVYLPDSITEISTDMDWPRDMRILSIGSGVEYLEPEMFAHCYNLESIVISPENPYYCCVDGAVYDIDVTTLIYYPLSLGLDYHVPATVTNIDAVCGYQYAELNIIFDENSTAYKTVDGVTYNANMTRVIYCNRSKTGAYVMPDTVTEIGDNAFSNCTGLTSVTVSKNVTSIVYGAFANCSALSKISMPDTVVEIGTYAFAECESLATVDLPENLVVIGEKSFYNSGLTALTTPGSLISIGEEAFANSAIANLTLNEGLQHIDYAAFYKTPVKKVALPDSFVSSGSYIFAYCTKLESLTFGNQLTGIASNSFIGCSALRSVTFPENIEFIGRDAFARCTALEEAVFENEGIQISSSAFYSCALKELKLGNSVTEIEQYTFAGNDFTEIALPESVTDIAYGAFANCKSLKNIDVPASAINIAARVFDNTAWYEEQPDGEVYLEHIFYDYKGYMSKDTVVVVKDGTTTLADNSFEDCRGMSGVQLPDSLKVIGEQAFYDCDGLTDLIIPEGVTSIGYYAFQGCDSLTTLVLPATLEYIGYGAFSYAPNLEHILFLGTEEQFQKIDLGDYYNWNVDLHFGTLEAVESYEPDCELVSFTYYECSECGTGHLGDFVLPTGHTPAGKPSVTPSTCTTHGVEQGYCTTCQQNYEVTLPLKEHTYKKAECTVCGLPEIRTAHPYGVNLDQTWTYTAEGATQITLTFAEQFDLGYDATLTITGSDGLACGYSGYDLEGGCNVTLPGDTVTIRLQTGSYNWNDSYGFEIIGISAEVLMDNNGVSLETEVGVVEAGTELVAEPTKLAEEAIVPAGFSKSSAQTYDIRLEKDGVSVQPNGEIVITLPVPENANPEKCQVFHVDDQGNMTNMNAEFNGESLVFVTDHLSYYVILESYDTAGVVQLMQAIIGDIEFDIDTMDQNNDGKLTIVDAVLLLRILSA
ncbi:MAG: leucine-rich repeat protein [Clostridia bacterium]|nr:leucine-rich repeat protein [Clostridia bacterium]